MVTQPMAGQKNSPATPPERGTHRRWFWAWVAGLSAVALLVVAGLAVLMTADDDSTVPSGDAAAAIAVVTQHNDAQNVADGDLMRATTTDDALYVIGAVESTMDEYIKLIEGYGPIQQTVTGDPTVVRDPAGTGDLQVSVPMGFGFPAGDSDGTMVYTVRKVDGEWKIAQLDRQV